MAKNIRTKREREKVMVSQMIALYCKTFCSNCRVHCYKPEMREKIREVMRFSGPRMIWYHPMAAISHVLETKKEKKRLEDCNET